MANLAQVVSPLFIPFPTRADNYTPRPKSKCHLITIQLLQKLQAIQGGSFSGKVEITVHYPIKRKNAICC